MPRRRKPRAQMPVHPVLIAAPPMDRTVPGERPAQNFLSHINTSSPQVTADAEPTAQNSNSYNSTATLQAATDDSALSVTVFLGGEALETSHTMPYILTEANSVSGQSGTSHEGHTISPTDSAVADLMDTDEPAPTRSPADETFQAITGRTRSAAAYKKYKKYPDLHMITDMYFRKKAKNKKLLGEAKEHRVTIELHKDILRKLKSGELCIDDVEIDDE